MKVSVATIRKMIREAVDECIDEQDLSLPPPNLTTPGGSGESGISGNKPEVQRKMSEAAIRRLIRNLVSEVLNEQATPSASGDGDPISQIEGMTEQYTSGGTWSPAGSSVGTTVPGPSGESGIGNKPTARGPAGTGRARGFSYERGTDRMARRAGTSPATAGASLEDLMARAAPGSPDFAAMAAGAPVPGSAARPATPSGEEVLRAGRARASEAMRALAAARTDKANRRREGGWGGGPRPGTVPPIPTRTGVGSIDDDPLGGLPPEELSLAESKSLKEMVRRAIKKALAEQKKTK